VPHLDAEGLVERLAPPESNEAAASPVDLWPAPPEPEAYYGLPGDIVRTIEPHSESDPVALLVQILVAFGSVIGRSAHFFVEMTRHACNLFALLVGETAKARKGTSWHRVRRIFSSVDETWATQCLCHGLSSGEGLIWAIRDPIHKLERDKHGDDVRDVLVDPGIADKRCLVQESEFAQALKVVAREGNTLSPVVRDAWDGISLRSMTKNSPARATDPHVGIIGHITDTELRRSLAETELSNGFANRFCFIACRRSKILPDGGALGEDDLAPLVERLRAAVDYARPAQRLSRSPAAKELWHSVYGALSDGKPGMLGSATARAEAQVLRLSMVYALMDSSDVIDLPHLRAALALWRYCEDSAKWIFGDRLGDPLADDILNFLRARGGWVSRTEISNHLGRHVAAGALSLALGLLERFGRAERREGEAGERGGRRPEEWRARR
jgi:hypothetical protein